MCPHLAKITANPCFIWIQVFTVEAPRVFVAIFLSEIAMTLLQDYPWNYFFSAFLHSLFRSLSFFLSSLQINVFLLLLHSAPKWTYLYSNYFIVFQIKFFGEIIYIWKHCLNSLHLEKMKYENRYTRSKHVENST